MKVKISAPDEPAADFETRARPNEDYPWMGWVICNPESLDKSKFSAVGYYFARKLFQELKVPIGVIEASAGGSHIEGWTPASGFASDPALAEFAKAAEMPKVKFQGTAISTLYNGMIHPIVPFSLRGILWYQGESNLIKGDSAIYAHKMMALIKSWRSVWKREMPFYFVQLPPLIYSARTNPSHTPTDLPLFREAQEAATELPRTGMVVTTDLGDLRNIHPPRKKEVGERLGLWALSKDYGRNDVEYSGPQYRQGSIEIRGSKAILRFEHVGKGLVSSDGQALTSFLIAGSDDVFFPARAEIAGDAIVVTSPQVGEPRVVRFAWDETATPNLFNRDGLPAIPFRTDNPFNQTRQDLPQPRSKP
jgi:sialate O-acetylesterase